MNTQQKTLLLIITSALGLSACNATTSAPPPPPGPLPTASGDERPTVNHSQISAQLQSAKNKWQEVRPANYQYTYQRTCFCPVEYTRPISVTVRGDQVSKVFPMPGDPPLPANRRNDGKTIEQLFATIEKAIVSNASSIKTTFDSQYGYPTQITIDHDFRMADEETYITTKDLQAVQ